MSRIHVIFLSTNILNNTLANILISLILPGDR